MRARRLGFTALTGFTLENQNPPTLQCCIAMDSQVATPTAWSEHCLPRPRWGTLITIAYNAKPSTALCTATRRHHKRRAVQPAPRRNANTRSPAPQSAAPAAYALIPDQPFQRLVEVVQRRHVRRRRRPCPPLRAPHLRLTATVQQPRARHERLHVLYAQLAQRDARGGGATLRLCMAGH